MADKKESSVLFSLRELRGLEDDRIKSESEAAAAKQAAEAKAKADAERAAKEAIEAKQRAEEDAVRAERERKESLDREERIRIAESERKAQVEAQMQLEQQRLHHEHQEKLASAAPKSHKLLYSIIAAMVAILVVVGIVFYRNTQAAKRESARAAAELAALQKTLDDTTAEADRINREISAIQSEIANANEADRIKLQERLAQKQREMAANSAKAQDAKNQIGSKKGGGKTPVKKGPGIDLNVDTNNATGGIKGN